MGGYYVKVLMDDFDVIELKDLNPDEVHFIEFKGKRYDEVRHGRWEYYEHREPQYDIMGIKTWAEAYKCSNCGFIHSVIENFGHYAFCPNCGSRMDLEGYIE